MLTTAACGGGSTGSQATTAPVVVTPSASLACSATAGLSLPAGWPAAVPVPAGLVVTRTERRSGDRLIAYGRVTGDFHTVVAFFNRALPAAGFTQSNGQLDPRDSESDFAGAAHSGRWTTGTSNDCPGTSDVTMLVTPPGGSAGAEPDPDKSGG